MICTGQRPVTGTIELIFESDHAKTTVVMSMNGQQMTMKGDSQKIGTPVHAEDPAGRQVTAPPGAPARPRP